MSSEAQQVSLDIRRIRLDGGTQIREKLDEEVVKEYAEQMREGAMFPPVMVIDDGQNHWLADGFHRLHALLALQRETIECLVYEGSQREAILVAIKANATHGLRRTSKDKRRAVEAILDDEVWSRNSTNWIAETCGVGRGLVEDVRRQLADSTNRPKEGVFVIATRLGQDGKLRPAHRTAGRREADDDPVAQALSCGAAFDACVKLLRRAVGEAERLAEGLGGRFLNGVRLADFRMHLSQAGETIAATRPSHRCGQCSGAGCECCEQAGWLCPAKQRLN